MPQKPQLMLRFFYSMGSTQRFPRSLGALDASKTSTYVGVFLFNGINTAVPPKPRGARCLKNLNLCWGFFIQWDQHSGSPVVSGRSMPQKPQLMLGFFYSMGSTQRFPRSLGALDASKTSTYVGFFYSVGSTQRFLRSFGALDATANTYQILNLLGFFIGRAVPVFFPMAY